MLVPIVPGIESGGLGRASGQTDLAIGTDVANRTRLETEGLIGFFVNQLVLRADLAGDPTFRDLLRRVRTTTLEAYANQDVPFDRLVATLGNGYLHRMFPRMDYIKTARVVGAPAAPTKR